MISKILKYIAEEINNYYSDPAMPPGEELVELGNIARLESSSGTITNLSSKVVLTMVQIEEEKSLKNNPHFIRSGESVVKINPAVFLNIYVLFSCADDDYEMALIRISRVINFFQRKYAFTPENAGVTFPSEHTEKLILDLFSMNFEQINHLWGVLGGKYLPSVLYRVRLIPVQKSEEVGADVVRTVQVRAYKEE